MYCNYPKNWSILIIFLTIILYNNYTSHREQEQTMLQRNDFLIGDIDDDLKFDFEEDERQVEENNWIRQNQQYEEDV